MLPSILPKAAPDAVSSLVSIDPDVSGVGTDADVSLEVGEGLCCVATAAASVGAPT